MHLLRHIVWNRVGSIPDTLLMRVYGSIHPFRLHRLLFCGLTFVVALSVQSFIRSYRDICS
jgi:hypothetical protein